MVAKKELTKMERISKEERRLKKYYKEVQPDKRAVTDGLIRRAAFMRISLEDMEIDLDANGFYELFSQSENQDPYERERPVARQYQSMNKNYQSIIKQLTDLLPKELPKEDGDGFDEFVSARE